MRYCKDTDVLEGIIEGIAQNYLKNPSATYCADCVDAVRRACGGIPESEGFVMLFYYHAGLLYKHIDGGAI